jgi:hypothetical protein
MPERAPAPKAAANPSDLDKHQRVKKRLLSPLNKAMREKLRPVDWFSECLPEHVWWHAMVEIYGKDEGVTRAREVLDEIRKVVPNEVLVLGYVSDFRHVPEDKRAALAPKLRELMGPRWPMYGAVAKLSEANPMNWIFEPNPTVDEEMAELMLGKWVLDLGPRRGDAAAMAQFLVLAELARLKKLSINVDDKETRELLTKYPNVPDKNLAAGQIGAMSKAFLAGRASDSTWATDFWRENIKRTPCAIPPEEGPEEIASLEALRGANGLSHDGRRVLSSLRPRLRRCFRRALELDADRDVAEVVAGLASRAIRFAEDVARFPILRGGVWNHAAVRMMSDLTITASYLLQAPPEKARLYKAYGLGRLKLAHRHAQDMVAKTQADTDAADADKLAQAIEKLEKEANLERWDQLVDINVGDFEGRNILERAKEADHQDTHRLFTTMSDSVHATWGHVRMQDMELCRSPTHGGHWLPYRHPDKVAEMPLTFIVEMANALLQSLEKAWRPDPPEGETDTPERKP